ncbi:MAG: HD domain-containing protein [Patescibacteria group bacterium]|nr:HD domain-containing protein [Patescibacteria group bacterium]MDD5294675.1 HD domain-containing protein [Patescibacteria group bacterium]MDD5554842.1 HD domain-containing protein [Patescibacteria group bacterium]
MPKDKNLKQILNFLHQAGELKKAYRFSENLCKEKFGDSSADHSWRLALMGFVIAEEIKANLDILKVLKIALVHDLPEAITGDIDFRLIAAGKITKEEKNKLEARAMKKFKKLLPPKIGQEIYNLWLEYETGKTREAKFIKTLDKIESILFFNEVKNKNKIDAPDLIGAYGNKQADQFPELKNIFKLIKKELKNEFKKSPFPWKKEYDI